LNEIAPPRQLNRYVAFDRPMKTGSIRLLGVITLLFEAGMFMALISPKMRMLGPLTAAAIVRISLFFLSATLVAVGLFFLRKWAAILFALTTGALATWLIVGTVGSVPFPWSLINFAFAFTLIVLTVVSIRSWSVLSWRGKSLL
jgi:hypothetical protein